MEVKNTDNYQMPLRLSVIIPSLNEGSDLRETVLNIVNTIGLHSYEIIIVDSGGTETSEIKDLSMVSILHAERPVRREIMGLFKRLVNYCYLLMHIFGSNIIIGATNS